MAVGDGGQLRPLPVQRRLVPAAVLPCPVCHGQGRHPHDAAAALAGVDGPLRRPVPAAIPPAVRRDGGEAGISRRPEGIELRHIQKPGPARLPGPVPRLPSLHPGEVLGPQPILIGQGRVAGGVPAGASQGAPGLPHQDAVGGEERHLGVVRDQGLPGGGIPDVVPDALRPEARCDLPCALELHGIAQGIPRRAAQKASPDAVPKDLLPDS